ncbi:MAG: alpha/beta fold hydrolase [Chloroflexi bacterium OHK40]
MPRIQLALLTLTIAMLLAGCVATAPAPLAPAIALSACRLSTPGLAVESVSAECGTLAVPEDRTAPSARSIDLRVVVLPATGRAAPDPLFLLAGGPGQAASEAFVATLPALRRVNQSRDLVLVDQRGTGASAPLSCPLEDERLTAAGDDPDGPAAMAYWRNCLDSLDADPAHFTTEAAVADLDAVRDALGYERVNLLGVSYGTRTALSYLRRYPERVRSLVLDGVVPPEMAIGDAMDRDGQRALDLTFSACEADQACAAAFPNLRANVDALLARLEREAPRVRLDNPSTGAPAEVTLTRGLAASTIFSLSYTPETTALIPLLIHTASAGDLRPLAAQSLITARELAESIDLGMRNAVLCAEDVPYYAATNNGTSYLGDMPQRALAAPCAVWPRGEVPPDARTPLNSSVPALLLSGERDPVTPPAYGEAVGAGLPNSLHIVAPGQGHNIFFRGCLPGLVADFLEAGSVAGLETDCVARLGPTPFFTSFTGPQP